MGFAHAIAIHLVRVVSARVTASLNVGSVATILILFLSITAPAQILQTHAVAACSGGTMTNGELSAVGVCGQPGGSQSSTGGRFIHYAGYLGTMILQPQSDTDADGLCNELDADNDADGMPDLAEIVAGTSPMLSGSLLAFTHMEVVSGQVRLQWIGGTSASQYLLRSRDAGAPRSEWSIVRTNLPPTAVTGSAADALPATGTFFYRLEAR